MESNREREEFSKRLHEALSQAEVPIRPSVVAQEFNRRFSGKPVSMYAARKWVMGDAIPAQEKLIVIARWLGVDASWLRFGVGSSETDQQHEAENVDYELMRAIAALSTPHQQVVRDLVKSLQKSEKESSGQN